MKNKSVAWAKKINTMAMKFMDGCLPITTNAGHIVFVAEFENIPHSQ